MASKKIRTTTEVYDKEYFESFFDENENEGAEIKLPDEGSVDAIAVFAAHKMEKRYYGNDFIEFYQQYMKWKLAGGEDRRVVDGFNCVQVSNAMNMIYLDGDYHIQCEDAERINEQIWKEYWNHWKKALERENYKYDYYTFVPVSFPGNKYGFHIFIFLDKTITNDSLLDMYETINQMHMKDSKLLEKIVEKDRPLSEIFDKNPITSRNGILPFAHKESKSRLYRADDWEDENGYFVQLIPYKNEEKAYDEQKVEVKVEKTDDEKELIKWMLDEIENGLPDEAFQELEEAELADEKTRVKTVTITEKYNALLKEVFKFLNPPRFREVYRCVQFARTQRLH
jgi:hypothetical protein